MLEITTPKVPNERKIHKNFAKHRTAFHIPLEELYNWVGDISKNAFVEEDEYKEVCGVMCRLCLSKEIHRMIGFIVANHMRVHCQNSRVKTFQGLCY